jgi:hypothetical protein
LSKRTPEAVRKIAQARYHTILSVAFAADHLLVQEVEDPRPSSVSLASPSTERVEDVVVIVPSRYHALPSRFMSLPYQSVARVTLREWIHALAIPILFVAEATYKARPETGDVKGTPRRECWTQRRDSASKVMFIWCDVNSGQFRH